MFGLVQLFMKLLSVTNTMENMIKTVNDNYFDTISDKLVTKGNNLQSSTRALDSTFIAWKTKITNFCKSWKLPSQQFHGIFVKIFSERQVARIFSTKLRFAETNDILHRAHKLHNEQLAAGCGGCWFCWPPLRKLSFTV